MRNGSITEMVSEATQITSSCSFCHTFSAPIVIFFMYNLFCSIALEPIIHFFVLHKKKNQALLCQCVVFSQNHKQIHTQSALQKLGMCI